MNLFPLWNPLFVFKLCLHTVIYDFFFFARPVSSTRSCTAFRPFYESVINSLSVTSHLLSFTTDTFKEDRRDFVKYPSIWVSLLFPCGQTQIIYSGKLITELILGPFSSSCMYMIQICLTTGDINFDHSVKVVFVKFLLCQSTSYFFSINKYLWGKM